MSLPHRCGGPGVFTHIEPTSRSAYLSAAALTEKALQKGNPAFLPFLRPSVGLAQNTYAALQAAHGDLPPLLLDTVVNDLPGLQTQVRQAHDKAMLQSLQAVFQARRNSEQQSASGVNATLPECAVSWTAVHPSSWMQCPSAFTCR